jgi:hypothetical protein
MPPTNCSEKAAAQDHKAWSWLPLLRFCVAAGGHKHLDSMRIIHLAPELHSLRNSVKSKLSLRIDWPYFCLALSFRAADVNGDEAAIWSRTSSISFRVTFGPSLGSQSVMIITRSTQDAKSAPSLAFHRCRSLTRDGPRYCARSIIFSSCLVDRLNHDPVAVRERDMTGKQWLLSLVVEWPHCVCETRRQRFGRGLPGSCRRSMACGFFQVGWEDYIAEWMETAYWQPT